MREVYWISDPIKTRVVREPKRGDILPDQPAICERCSRNFVSAQGKETLCDRCKNVPRGLWQIIPTQQRRNYNLVQAWRDMVYEGRHYCKGDMIQVEVRSGEPIVDVPTATKGGCAICGDDLHGISIICDRCHQERRGA